jgi:hypothetical protein
MALTIEIPAACKQHVRRIAGRFLRILILVIDFAEARYLGIETLSRGRRGGAARGGGETAVLTFEAASCEAYSPCRRQLIRL